MKVKAIYNRRTGRAYTMVKGKPFYQSSGRNSGLKSTWFPFFGVDHKTNPYGISKTESHSTGWLVKAYKYAKSHHHQSKLEQYKKAKFNQHYEATTEKSLEEKSVTSFYKRLTYLDSLIISARIGGGVWETQVGMELYATIQQDYPYDDYSPIEVVRAVELTLFSNLKKEYKAVNDYIRKAIKLAKQQRLEAASASETMQSLSI